MLQTKLGQYLWCFKKWFWKGVLVMCSNRFDMRRRHSVFLWSFLSFTNLVNDHVIVILMRISVNHSNFCIFNLYQKKCKSTVHHEIVNYRDRKPENAKLSWWYDKTTWSHLYHETHECPWLFNNHKQDWSRDLFSPWGPIEFRSTRLDLYVW